MLSVMSVQRLETEWFSQVTLPAQGVQTLAWRDDELVDWAGGHRGYSLDGKIRRAAYTSYGPSFDGAVAAEDGRHVAIFQRLGTKALLLRDGKLVRELDRSYYCANAFEYPITFATLPGGRTGLVHCPTSYRRLEIDDALTDERLTTGMREPGDFFHSRLSASPGGRFLASAGWVWHPLDSVLVFDLVAALRDPRLLDRVDWKPWSRNVGLAEESSAAWLDAERLAISGSDEAEDPDEVAEAGDAIRVRPRGLATFDASARKGLTSVVLPEVAGTLMAAGPRHVISFFREPKLIAVETGQVLHRWEGLYSGEQIGNISGEKKAFPPLALDPVRGRFAVAGPESITVVMLRPERFGLAA